MTLGADAGDTFRLVVGQALGYVVAGGVLGLAGALALSRLISGLLFGVSLPDPATLVAGFLFWCWWLPRRPAFRHAGQPKWTPSQRYAETRSFRLLEISNH